MFGVQAHLKSGNKCKIGPSILAGEVAYKGLRNFLKNTGITELVFPHPLTQHILCSIRFWGFCSCSGLSSSEILNRVFCTLSRERHDSIGENVCPLSRCNLPSHFKEKLHQCGLMPNCFSNVDRQMSSCFP